MLDLSGAELSDELQTKLQSIHDSNSEATHLDRWRETCQAMSTLDLAPAAYRAMWDACFVDWDVESNGPAPMWSGSHDDVASKSNLVRWKSELSKSAADSFPSLKQSPTPCTWWMQDRAAFWQCAVEKMGIVFFKQSEQALDDSGGAAHAVWFPEARMNIVESCFQAADDAIAIVAQASEGPIRRTTYGELKALSNRISNSVVRAGYKPGDALAVVMPMTELSVAIYLGVVAAGCTIVSIADSFAPPEIATRLKISKAKAVFTYDHQIRAGQKLSLFSRVAEASELRAIVIAESGQAEAELREQDMNWDDFLVDDQNFEPVIRDAHDTVNILFSSGTTGEPKAIPWSHLTPIKCAIDGWCHQDIQPGHVCVWPTNLGWMMGPWLIFASLINRATIGLFEGAPMGPEFGQFVQDSKANMLGVVPTIVRAWRKFKVMEKFDWSSIHTFSSTGESSQRDDMFYLSALAGMRPVIEYCGGTEIGGGYATSSVEYPNVPAAFNSPGAGLDFVLLDEARQPADEGEVFLIGPSIGLSTELLNRDHFETYFAETPVLETGDYSGQTLRRHGDHFQRFASSVEGDALFAAGGRVDDTMNLGGIKISSAEIERIVNLLEEVRESAAVSVATDGGPAKLFMFVVAEGEQEPRPLKMKMTAQIRGSLNPLFKISKVKLVESLPRTASGKVMRRELRKLV